MDESLIGIIVAAGCGLLCAGLGAYMVVTGNPSLLHSYHYATTPLADRPALARESGAGLIVTGVGCALMGLSDFFGVWAGVAGIVLLVAGIAINLISIIRHNGSLFSFPSSGEKAHGRSGLHIGLNTGGGVVLGAIIGLVCIVPGVYMIATGDVSLLHSYHYEHIAAADLPAFSLIEGLSMIGLGIGLAICFAAGGRMTMRPIPLWAKVLMAVGGIIWGASLIALIVAIPTFGGSLS